jgi:hypothetical protein
MVINLDILLLVIILNITFPAFMASDRGWNGIAEKGKWPDGALRPITLNRVRLYKLYCSTLQ